MNVKNSNNSAPIRDLNGSKIGVNHTTSTNDKEKKASILSLTRDVANLCFGGKNHFLFFLCIFVAGISGGVSDAFSYPRYQELGCSTTHMGQSRLLSSCAGAIVFWYSGRFSRSL